MEISINTAKKLLGRELQEHYQAACSTTFHNVQRGLIYVGYRTVKNMLEKANTVEEIEEVLSECDYMMSLQDWINSL